MDIQLTPQAESAYSRMSVMVSSFMFDSFNYNFDLIHSFMNQFGGVTADMESLDDVQYLINKFHGVI